MTLALIFTVLILVNQIPEIHSVAFSGDLLSLSLLYSMTNARFFPLHDNFPHHPLLKSENYVTHSGVAWSHLQSCLQVCNVFLSLFSQLFTSQLQLLMDCAVCSLFQPSRISVLALSKQQEELSSFMSSDIHEQKGQFSVINTACVMKDFPNWEKQLIKPSFSENGRDRRPGICLYLIFQSLTFSTFLGLDWDCPQLFANFGEEQTLMFMLLIIHAKSYSRNLPP